MEPKRFKTRLLALIVATTLILPFSAHSKPFVIKNSQRIERPQRFDIVGQLHRNSFGASLWFSFPLLHKGFISKLNDSFHLEAGLITSYIWVTEYYSAFYGIPALGVRWDFHLTQEWTVFATAKFVWMLGFTRNPPNPLYPYPSVGVHWNVDRDLSLRLETSHEGFLQAGLSFPF